MSKKWIFVSSLILIFIVMSISVVSADDNNIVLGEISFKIPSDYDECVDFEITNHTKNYGNMTIKESHRTFCNKDGKYLGITVDEFSKPTSLKDLKINGDEKTIGSQEGIHSYDDLNFFKFEKDGKIITVSYEDESIIEKVIN